MTPIPVPVRQRIVQRYERGKSTREIAQFCGFCVAAVCRVRQQFHQRGTLEPRTHRSGRRTLLTAERRQRLEELLAEHPDATLADLGAGLDGRFRTSMIDLWVRKLGWGYKTLAAAERERPGVAEKRAHRHERLVSHPVHRLVFVVLRSHAAHGRATAPGRQSRLSIDIVR